VDEVNVLVERSRSDATIVCSVALMAVSAAFGESSGNDLLSYMKEDGTMSERASKFATQIAQTANDAIATVEGCSDEQWKAITTAEQWPVAVVACHLADLHDVFFQLIDAAKSNKSSLFELTQEDIDAVNADRARTRADVSKTEIIGRRRDTGPRLSALVAGLSDQELEFVVGAISGYDLTIASFAELAVVGHYREHLASIRSAIGN